MHQKAFLPFLSREKEEQNAIRNASKSMYAPAAAAVIDSFYILNIKTLAMASLCTNIL